MCACSTDEDDLDEELSENDAPKVKKKKKAKKSSRESKGSKRNRSRREVMAFFVSVCVDIVCVQNTWRLQYSLSLCYGLETSPTVS